ncbi:MAG: MFS transporter [Acidimicrobiales bacterium]|nr:MFS transporter [Acidimicrobiales bacterium]
MLPPTPARSPWHRRALLAAVAGAVAIAFADSSIVVLALPELYGQFDTTVVGVSMVVTVYNVALAAVALALVPLLPRVRPALLLGAGFAVFSVASLACGLAGSLDALLVARVAQGVGAAGALTASVSLLGRLLSSDERGRWAWALAATVGTAVGPALGGVLTELATWRSIFLVQAPLAAMALLALADRGVRAAPPEPARPVGGRSAWANAAYVFLFGALVGALFLAVLLVVVVWRYPPAQGALVVTALPVATLAVRPLARRLPGEALAVAGPLLLAGGLLGLAFLPAPSAAWAMPALALCGAGLGLAAGLLGTAAVPAGAPPLRAGALTVGARHLGFVLGLLLVAPLLASSLDAGAREAARSATATVLDGRVPLLKKVPLSLDLGRTVLETPRGEVPDLSGPFERNGADDDEGVAELRDDLLGAMDAAITRAFRSSFTLAAGLALAAVVPALGVVVVRRTRWVVLPAAALAGVLVPGAFLVAERQAGAADYGVRAYAEPCSAGSQPYPERGFDAWLQRIALSGLNGAACELGVSREELVLSLADDTGFEDLVTWEPETLEDALRSGFRRAIDDGEDRGGMPGWVAAALRFVTDRAPIDWLLGRVDLPFYD